MVTAIKLSFVGYLLKHFSNMLAALYDRTSPSRKTFMFIDMFSLPDASGRGQMIVHQTHWLSEDAWFRLCRTFHRSTSNASAKVKLL